MAARAPWYLRPWGPDAASLPREVWILWWGTLVNRIGGFVVPFFPLYLSRLGFSIGDIAWIACAYGSGSFAASVVGGILSDRIGRKPTMMASLLLGAVCLVGLGWVQSLGGFIVMAFATGLVTDAYRPSVLAWAQDLVTPAQRRVVSSLFYWAINLGFAIASALGGFAATIGYRWLFIADAATMAAFGIIVWITLVEPQRARSSAGGGSIFGALHDKRLAWFMPMSFLFALAMWQNNLALPIDMRAKGFDDVAFGLLASINGFAIIILQPFISRWLERFSLRATLAGGAVLFGLGLGAYGIAASHVAYALAIIVWTIGEIAVLPASSAYIMSIAPADKRGRYQGVLNASWGVASAVAPLIGAGLYDAFGTMLWGLVLASLLVAAAGYYMVVRPTSEPNS